MALTRTIARPLLAAGFAVGGLTGFKNAKALAPKAKPVTQKVTGLLQRVAPQVPVAHDEVNIIRANSIAQIVAAGTLAAGRAPRLSAVVLALSIVPTTITGHPFWQERDPAARNQQRLQFAKNASMLGGVLLAAVDTEGKPGVAWRANRAAKDLRREARRAAKDARVQAKLARASLG